MSNRTPCILGGYWNPGVQTFDSLSDAFLNFRNPIQNTCPLPDAYDTVIRLQIVRSEADRKGVVDATERDFDLAVARRPFP